MTAASPSAGIPAIVTNIEPPAGLDKAELVSLVIDMNMAGAKSQGFCSSEIQAPKKGGRAWRVVQRFSTADDAEQWRNSSSRNELIAKLVERDSVVFEEIAENYCVGDGATIIDTDVKAGMEEEYFAWEAKIQKAQAKTDGYCGAFWQPPMPGRSKSWSTLVHYDSPLSLARWFDSDLRKQLLDEASKFVESKRFQKVDSAFPGWFPVNAKGDSPASWKTGTLVLLVLFPIIIGEIRFLTASLAAFEPAMRTFINLVLSVFGSTLLMPHMSRAFNWWLLPTTKNTKRTELKGIAACALILALELALAIALIN